jgi:hypothetical protein
MPSGCFVCEKAPSASTPYRKVETAARSRATDQVGDPDETATDVITGSRREVGQASLNRHLLAGPLDLRVTQESPRYAQGYGCGHF